MWNWVSLRLVGAPLFRFVSGQELWRSDMYLVEYRLVGKGCDPTVIIRTLRALAKQGNFIDIHALPGSLPLARWKR